MCADRGRMGCRVPHRPERLAVAAVTRKRKVCSVCGVTDFVCVVREHCVICVDTLRCYDCHLKHRARGAHAKHVGVVLAEDGSAYVRV